MKAGVTFRGRTYKQLIKSGGIGNVNKTIKKELSNFSFTLNNSTREIVDFELETGFEGLVCVKRLLDYTVSVNLDDSIVQFTGRCEKPDSFDKESNSVPVVVKQILNQTETNVPRRTFSPDDAEGRPASDLLFEGFRYQARSGSVVYDEIVKKRFLLFFTKKVKESRTLQYSSRSDIDSTRSVPLCLGRAQEQAILLAAADVGTSFDGTVAFCDGHEHGIEAFVNMRSVTPGVTIGSVAQKLGRQGGTVDDATHQANDDPGWIGAGTYSRTAYARFSAGGTSNANDDPLPDIVSIVLGLKVKTPNSAGVFNTIAFSDNPVVLCRWLINSEYYFNLSDDWFDDAENFVESEYCEHILQDTANTDTVQLNASQTGIAGTEYFNYQSTGTINPKFFQNRYSSAPDTDQFLQEADYQFYAATPYNSDDLDGDGVPDYTAPPVSYRRRYTLNVLLSEPMKAADFLFDIMFPTFNGYLVQKATGKLAIRCAKPEDFAFVHAANTVGATEIRVKNINPFVTNPGRLLIGANLPTSEVRKIVDYRYDTTIAYAVTASGGGVSTSSATLTGGSTTVAPFVTITVSTNTGTKSLTVNGYALSYTAIGTDTNASVAGMLAGIINSHNELNKYIKATWAAGASTFTISSRIGYLELDNALEEIHNAAIANPTTAPTLTETAAGTLAAGAYQVAYSFVTIEGETLTSNVQTLTIAANKKITVSAVTMPARVLSVNWYASVEANGIRRRLIKSNDGSSWVLDTLPVLDDAVEPVYNTTAAECHRIAMAFSDKSSTAANLNTSNTLKGTLKFPLGSKTPSTNRVDIKYRDASQDFQLTELRVKDKAHIKKVKKVNAVEINGAGIDNYHQARRLANQKLAQWRDGDSFIAQDSDGEALLLEEGDVVCVSDDSGRFRNEPVRIEDLSFSSANGYPKIGFTARKYRRHYFDDQIQEKLVPLPIVNNTDANTEQSAAVIYQYSQATNTTVQIGVNNYSNNARFRKVEISNAADMSGATEQTQTYTSAPPPVELVTKTGEALAVTKYFRVSHSSNGTTFGLASNILSVTFANAGGTGGDPPDDDPFCFGGETLFTMADGRQIRMENLYNERDKYIGQFARAFDKENNIVYGKIGDVFCKEEQEYLMVKFSTDNQPIRVTSKHRFLTESGKFKQIGKLRVADKVKEFRNNKWGLSSIEWIEEGKDTITVYNAHIKKHLVYFANDKAVHNVKPIEA